ncbi:hypothetical protein L6164_027827 [Bauhinia variegata]|uniref:Uncharacterized protein n=1 Tax=Bauhinia variegata TaxID=167791 RepID=A0ACB9LV52_BAUVA|nr:hypothetical protein L6164_027827 [Bauhinia variegata]
MGWLRGDCVGRGSFATVNLAVCSQFTTPTVVKSSDVFSSSSLKNEKQVLDRLGLCPEIIRCFGDDYTTENGEDFYNLFLEYASGGTLFDQLKNHGGRLPESDVRRYIRSIIRGLAYIHDKGFVHCDIKLQNILVLGNGDVKIADFGLAKRTEEKQSMCECRGTPLSMSPESVNDNEYEPPADVWALGCAVVEMVTGKPAWNVKEGSNIFSLMLRIGLGDELPEVPNELSEAGKDFLSKCFVKDPRKRWTAEMLLKHPFVADNTLSSKTSSPRCHFDFPDWVSAGTASVPCSPESVEWSEWKFDSVRWSNCTSPVDRLRQLVTDKKPNWSESDSWCLVSRHQRTV